MADSTIKAKTIKRSDIKTYESVLENDNYLQSVYLQLIEIENLFHCLPDFIVQSNIMFNVAIDGIKDNYTPDIIIKTPTR